MKPPNDVVIAVTLDVVKLTDKDKEGFIFPTEFHLQKISQFSGEDR